MTLAIITPARAALHVPTQLGGGDRTFSAAAERTPPQPMGTNSVNGAGFERLPEGHSCRFDSHLLFSLAALWVQRKNLGQYAKDNALCAMVFSMSAMMFVAATTATGLR